jgi:hypothetical protein
MPETAEGFPKEFAASVRDSYARWHLLSLYPACLNSLHFDLDPELSSMCRTEFDIPTFPSTLKREENC